MTNSDLQNNSPLVLVVDDERALRQLLNRAMKQEGYQVIEACNGLHCLDICQDKLPDIVLLDAMMPGLNGFSCCTQLQTLLGKDCPPILMITVLDDPESVDRAFSAGATDYITKPIDWHVLNQRVSRLLASRGAIAELQQKIQRECLLTVKVETANRELQRLSSVDSLTQVANRYYFNEYLQREWNRLEKHQLPLSLILCNIAHEYQVNDECWRQIANTINKCKRRGADLVARYDTKEFAIVLPNTEAEVGLQVAEAIRSAIKAIDAADCTAHCTGEMAEFISLSLGVTNVIPTPELSANQLIKRTEKVLNQAKLAGRDRIVATSEN
ncbi:MAG: diguanylate cyclase [Desmonostoc vinosum HA7617-LM4]|jgi:diguanylate cyclase (GGDEF)-like protein|nr:diguanylate cyclase [Desmonostoc vinosum HA7617-LM4]